MYARLCTCPTTSLESNSEQTLQKVLLITPQTEVPHVHMHAKRSHTCTLKLLQSMPEFSGLWKLQCPEAGHYTEEEVLLFNTHFR